MAIDRYLTKTIAKIASDGGYEPDSGHAVGWATLRDEAGTTVATASENSASSEQKRFEWDSSLTVREFGQICLDGVVQTHLGTVRLGREPQFHWFYQVTVYSSADTPSGAVGAPKTLTTGSGSLSTDGKGNTTFRFTNPPLVFFVNKQTRSAKQIGLVTVSGGNATFTVSVTDDGDNYDATTCRADILIVSRD